MSPKFLIVFFLLITSNRIFAQKYRTLADISYCKNTDTDAYKKERCKLDLYIPTDRKDFSTIVWFHGGGLEGGNKFIPLELKEKGVAVVAVNYRLSPKEKAPGYIEDAAEAVAWAFAHIASYGGDPAKIYVSGHSAGGYLALMVGLDSSYLHKYGVDANRIKGLAPISGQTNTHYTIKKERGQSMIIPQIDQYAPITFARKDAPPIVLITGDARLELPARYEENAHLTAILKQVGHAKTSLYQLQGFDHGAVYAPGCLLLLNWIKELEK
ncbi:alpha/beta hydrolase [Sphingobacterium sp. BIGb0165]|uniref:alpha/beta hydrolase n=1 Tax=Sphingobacterium sp. BIGb0165 TaxID=2940615 RepID=UPI002167142F|nr:alpha/beta hydrolase [Sphingobacterium sp. BIGb0165]MCS4229240.1 acetyl esterase/lipase [Sphingobacterium sp. BIGb0165]